MNQMKRFSGFILILMIAAISVSCNNKGKFKEKTTTYKSPKVEIVTDSGTIVVRLYDETPIHRDNFVKLVKQQFYDSLMFHRIIPNFMIQGGDPDSKRAKAGNQLGDGGDNMPRLTAEIKPGIYHKRGVLAAARDDNPEKKSSACQFYLVQGKVYTVEELTKMQERRKFTLTEEQMSIYTTIGGTPWLDGNYTVFGEIISGMEVVDKIAKMPRDVNDRPRTDIRMYMRLLKK